MTRIVPSMRWISATALAAVLIVANIGAADARSGRDCRQEWRAHKADFNSQGKSRRSFIRACKAEKNTPQMQPGAGTRTQ
jgi:hypothetical protein